MMEHLIRLHYIDTNIAVVVPRNEVAYVLVWPTGTTTNDYLSQEDLLEAWPNEDGVIVRKTVIVEQMGRTTQPFLG
jgi:hypothetical protein